MLHEFAVDPSLFSDYRIFLNLKDRFGVHKGRLLVEFPKKWRKMVYSEVSNLTPKQQSQLESWLKGRDTVKPEFFIQSGRDYKEQADWLLSAEEAHAQKAFQAILSQTNPRKHSHVLCEEDCDDEHPLFHCPTEIIMPKTPEDFFNASGKLLSISTQAIFVDPYWGAGANKEKWLTVFERFLSALSDKIVHVWICTNVSPKGEIPEFRREDIQNIIDRVSSPPVAVKCFLVEFPQCMDDHNRFILTDRGGLKFPWGLDAHKGGVADTVNLMDRDVYKQKFSEFRSLCEKSCTICIERSV